MSTSATPASFSLFAQDGCRRCQWFKDQLIDVETGFFDAAVNVANGGYLTNDDMKIGFQSNATHPNGFLDPALVIYGVFLRKHVKGSPLRVA